MNTLLFIILILITVLFILLAIPISMSFAITKKQHVEGYARIIGLFGLIKFQTNFPGVLKNKKKPVSHEKNLLQFKSKTVSTKSSSQNFSLITRSVFRRHIIKFIKRILKATHAKNLYLRCRIGLGDPADTGRLWAVMGPLSAFLKNLQILRIELEPEFTNDGIEIESHGHFHLIPLQFIALTIAFILSPTTLRAWKTLR